VAVLAAGATILEGLINTIGSGQREEPLVCTCGHKMESNGLRVKEVLTILGPVSYKRSMYQCPDCGAVRYPGDEVLDVEDTTRSPGVRRMMARAGSNDTFKEAKEDLRIYAGIEVSAKDIERVAEGTGEAVEVWRKQQSTIEDNATPPVPWLYISYDGTGVPMVPQETEGRKGKQSDGSAKTREVKLGCVFTQTTVDKEGRPVRDPDSTSFTGAIETAEEFGWRIYGEAVRRGLYGAQKVVVLGDGAQWIKNLAEMHFPQAIQIVDLYHAREHVANLCKILFKDDEKRLLSYREKWWIYLDGGMSQKIIAEAKRKLSKHEKAKKEALSEINYFKKNKKRMQYDRFRAQGFFVGSGVVEAGCKSIIAQRLKRSGMEWTVRGANAIISLRCMINSNRFEDYWCDRAA